MNDYDIGSAPHWCVYIIGAACIAYVVLVACGVLP